MLPILAGESAFIAWGLTTLVMNTKYYWTLDDVVLNYNSRDTVLFTNPYAKDARETTLDSINDTFLTPSQERAIVEYCVLRLLSGVYTCRGNTDVSTL